MDIIMTSKRVLQEVYALLTEKSCALYVSIPMDDMAEKLHISTETLNLCIHYLIESGYLKGDFTYNRNSGATKQVLITPLAINKIENTTL